MAVNVHEAKTHLSRLIERVEAGEEIIICRSGKPVAKLVPILGEQGPRVPGSMRGLLHVGDDFDAPLPTELLEKFLGQR